MEQHYLKSSYRKKLIEHLLVGELLKLSWVSGAGNIEISKPDVGSQGHDLVADESSILHHIQLKAAKLVSNVSAYIEEHY